MFKQTTKTFLPQITFKNRDYNSTLKALETLIIANVPVSERPKDVSTESNVSAMKDYVKRIQLDISKLNVIHVAGTKGKGSTCMFCESILKNSGYKTGLYTSPHLLDVRERIRIDGEPISKEKFTQYFWQCWDALYSTTNEQFPSMATYFRFLTLLCLKAFVEEKVDVAIVEVGLGGRLDSTNIFEKPVVCGIASLGYDHMEILGHTIEEISAEKAGIMKKNVPVITQPQLKNAMKVLKDHSEKVESPFYHAPDLSEFGNPSLGLSGKHQELNAALALSLCYFFFKSQNVKLEIKEKEGEAPTYKLSNEVLKGLKECYFMGRGEKIFYENNVHFYLDGAHTQESLELCVKWFGEEIKKEEFREKRKIPSFKENELHHLTKKDVKTILVFNYTEPRDPMKLMIPLLEFNFDLIVLCPIQSMKESLTKNVKTSKSQLEKLITLKENLKEDQRIVVAENIDQFVEWTLKTQKNVDILITGSLYLVGDFKLKFNPDSHEK